MKFPEVKLPEVKFPEVRFAEVRFPAGCVVRIVASYLLFVLVLSPIGATGADESASDHLDGWFLVGWRSVDVNGSSGKYRQHVDLDDGARLFGLDLDFRPAGSFADRLTLRIDQLGGDPFESIDLELRRHGDFRLRFERRKSTFVYADILEDHPDFFSFDFDRVRDALDFELNLTPRARLNIDLERYSKNGSSTVPLDIQRDEFELDQPIAETMDGAEVSFSYDWKHASLVLSERIREYENAREIFLPGRSLGLDPDDATVLDFFFLDQPTEIESRHHTARLTASPSKRLQMTVGATVEDLDLDTRSSERSEGTDFRGLPFSTNDFHRVGIQRDFSNIDFDGTYLISDRVAIVGALRRQEIDQDGRIGTVDDLAASQWQIKTTGAELGVEIAAAPRVTVTVGLREESREAFQEVATSDSTSDHVVDTSHTGLFAALAWRPSAGSSLSLEVEESTYDDPFTLASPTDRTRVRLRGRLQRSGGLFGSASLLYQDHDNGNTQWSSESTALTLRTGVRRDEVEASLGWTAFDVERSIDQEVKTLPGFLGGITFLVPVLYDSQSDFIDGRLRWHTTEILTLGADVRRFENAGDFTIERQDLRFTALVELHRGYLLQLGVRSVEYEETLRGLNDYDAEIVELGVGYRF